MARRVLFCSDGGDGAKWWKAKSAGALVRLLLSLRALQPLSSLVAQRGRISRSSSCLSEELEDRSTSYDPEKERARGRGRERERRYRESKTMKKLEADEHSVFSSFPSPWIDLFLRRSLSRMASAATAAAPPPPAAAPARDASQGKGRAREERRNERRAWRSGWWMMPRSSRSLAHLASRSPREGRGGPRPPQKKKTQKLQKSGRVAPRHGGRPDPQAAALQGGIERALFQGRRPPARAAEEGKLGELLFRFFPLLPFLLDLDLDLIISLSLFFSFFFLFSFLSQFVYVKESFAPSLDERIGVLALAYGSEGGTKLTLNYSTTPAWG